MAAFFAAAPLPAVAQDEKEKPFGIEERVPWTTSRIQGTPEPPRRYRLQGAFPEFKFTRPVEAGRLPDSNRLLIVEQDGNIYSFPQDGAGDQPDLFIALKEAVPKFAIAYGLAIDPGFRTNRYVYLSYVLQGTLPEGTRVSRFRLAEGDPPRLDPASEQILITWLAGGHNGACLKFGPDGYLYITTGDGRMPNPPDVLRTGQDCSDLLSSVLRIDVHPAGGDRPYAIPADNPFVGRPNVRPEIWSFGFRNPWKLSFDRETGDLWVGDVGWDLWELVFKVERGANYGWSVVEGSQPIHPDDPLGPAPISPPTAQHPHSEARSITGGYVYRGTKFPDLQGAYIYGDYETGKIWALHHEEGAVNSPREIADTRLRIITFGEDHDGELIVVDYGGSLYRFEKNEPAGELPPPFPRKLSETGLFASVPGHLPAPGVIPYSVNVEQWADGATTERLLGLPGDSQIGPGAPWNLPTHAVVAKTLSLEMEVGKPESRRRIETQILHRHPEGWRAYTYAWNEEGGDADLVGEAGDRRLITIRDPRAPGGQRRQRWEFLSRANCFSCHNGRGGRLRAVDAAQWNREHRYGEVSDNQLRTLRHLGLFSSPLPPETSALAIPHDRAASLERRARTYLHYNCSFCHRENGGGLVPMNLVIGQPLERLAVLDVAPQRGDFGIEAAKLVAPGEPLKSILYYRMAKLGSGRMPHLGSSRVDPQGIELIYEWIRSLPRTDDPRGEAFARIASAESAEVRKALVREAIASTDGALALMRALDRVPALAKQRHEIAGFVAGSDVPAQVRDLFDRFLPDDQRATTTIKDPALILSLQGDVARGRALFATGKSAACLTCHLLDGQGRDLGPPLTRIGGKLTPPQILESLLDPSKSIPEGFAGYTATMADGTVTVGRLLSRSAGKVVMRDLAAQEVILDGSAIKRLEPLPNSLMPAGLLGAMSDQEIADLVAYLASRKEG